MTALVERLQLKERLPRTWPAFFERHGNFTPAQLAVIPLVLDGKNVMLCAPTASGKTEAVLAPLIERLCSPVPTCPERGFGCHAQRAHDVAGKRMQKVHARRGLAILYVTPTRALVNDLAARLAHPLETLGLHLGVKTGDRDTLRPRCMPDVLLTTPESLDSLLTKQARLLIHLRAIVIDEIHLFDGTPRGDQLRVLLNRVRHVREYAHSQGHTGDARIQYAALSATLPEPLTVASRYFTTPRVVEAGGRPPLVVDWVPLQPEDPRALVEQLHTFRRRGLRKALVFCNSRSEIEAYAAAVRESSPFGDAVYVHYSNLDPRRRREIEQEFGASNAAICFASTTLELGIDIGSVDIVLLIGPPGSQASFLQRIGRGNRRGGPGGRVSHAMCLYRSVLERLLFEALCASDTVEGHVGSMPAGSAFRPAVAVQQIFSLLKQSPTGALRLPELARYFERLLPSDDLREIVGRLVELRYLAPGRPGEWRAGEQLQQLFDEQGKPSCSLSIYGNIQSDAGKMVTVRDQHTHQVVAKIERWWLQEESFTLQGRPVIVEWHDGDALWIQSDAGPATGERLFYRSGRQLLEYALARRLPEQLGLEPGAAPLVAVPNGYFWFHWLGDIYGRAVQELLRFTIAAGHSSQPGLCLRLPEALRVLPDWSPEQVRQYLEDSYQSYEAMLALGPFQRFVPVELRRHAVVDQFDVEAFLGAVSVLRPTIAPEEAREGLVALLEA